MTLHGAEGVAGDTWRRNVDLFHDAYTAELAHFVDCARTGATPDPTGRDARAALAIALAAIRSAGTGHPVRLAEVEPGRSVRHRPNRTLDTFPAIAHTTLSVVGTFQLALTSADGGRCSAHGDAHRWPVATRQRRGRGRGGDLAVRRGRGRHGAGGDGRGRGRGPGRRPGRGRAVAADPGPRADAGPAAGGRAGRRTGRGDGPADQRGVAARPSPRPGARRPAPAT